MSKTDRGLYDFVVKEYDKGEPWIMLEPVDSDLQLLAGGFQGFDLPPNTSYEKAKEIAQYMNDNLGKMTYTYDL